MGLALVFSIILAIVHFWSEKLNITNKLWNIRAVSFIAGISVTYAFLYLLPEAYQSFETQGKFVFIFIIMGFTLVHITEKYIYKHQSSDRLLHSLKEVHSIAFFFYYLLLGAILVDIAYQGAVQATLFFIPLLFYGAVGFVSLDKIHRKVSERGPLKFALSLSAIIGVLISDLLLQTGVIFDAIFALVIGGFIYIALIDFVPRERRGEPAFFVLGVFIYTILISTLLL